MLAVLYFLARALDMYVTLLGFHTAFATLLFALVVVFQEDLRRMLVRVSAWRTVRLRPAYQHLPERNRLRNNTRR